MIARLLTFFATAFILLNTNAYGDCSGLNVGQWNEDARGPWISSASELYLSPWVWAKGSEEQLIVGVLDLSGQKMASRFLHIPLPADRVGPVSFDESLNLIRIRRQNSLDFYSVLDGSLDSSMSVDITSYPSNFQWIPGRRGLVAIAFDFNAGIKILNMTTGEANWHPGGAQGGNAVGLLSPDGNSFVVYKSRNAKLFSLESTQSSSFVRSFSSDGGIHSGLHFSRSGSLLIESAFTFSSEAYGFAFWELGANLSPIMLGRNVGRNEIPHSGGDPFFARVNRPIDISENGRDFYFRSRYGNDVKRGHLSINGSIAIRDGSYSTGQSSEILQDFAVTSKGAVIYWTRGTIVHCSYN